MRITVRVPDELGKEVKRRTDDVSAYVADAIADKLQKENRDEARHQLLRFAGTGVDPSIHEVNKRERRDGDRDFSKE